MRSRAGPVERVPLLVTGRPSRGTTRSCTGTSADTSRPSCAASTGSTRIRSSPSAAPPKTADMPSSSAASLRQLVGRVRTTDAVARASR